MTFLGPVKYVYGSVTLYKRSKTTIMQQKQLFQEHEELVAVSALQDVEIFHQLHALQYYVLLVLEVPAQVMVK